MFTITRLKSPERCVLKRNSDGQEITVFTGHHLYMSRLFSEILLIAIHTSDFFTVEELSLARETLCNNGKHPWSIPENNDWESVSFG